MEAVLEVSVYCVSLTYSILTSAVAALCALQALKQEKLGLHPEALVPDAEEGDDAHS